MSEQTDEQTQRPLWRAIRLDEFRSPKEPTSEAVRQSIRNIWQRLWHKGKESLPSHGEIPELRSAPRSLLDRLVPTPDHVPGVAEAVAALLDEHYEDNGRHGPCLVLVAPPHHDIHRFVRDWASERDVRLIEPPSGHAVLETPGEWLDDRLPIDAPYAAMPQLERYFLRHYRGLDLVRRWVEALWQSGQRGVITCDSWAWAFLEHVCPLSLLQPQPLTPAPFEAEDLERWIREEVRHTYAVPVTFRRADTGKRAVRAPDDEDGDYSDEYLVHLAAYSRGNPLVAWSIWRDSLSIAASDDDEGQPSAQAEAESEADRGHTIWVRPWEKVTRPELAGQVDTTRLFLLHTLLLHGGLDLFGLQTVLTLPPVEIGRHLQPLRSAGVVEQVGDCWQVTAAGYPAVRGVLRQEGFLVDSL